MEMNLEQFNPTLAELNRLAEESRAITITNFEDPTQLDAVHKQRMVLKKVRVEITKKGKEFREEALAFQKKVIEKEKELIGIIQPEEDRLDALEEDFQEAAVKRERERKWPERLKRLKEIELVPGTSDGYVIQQMSDADFETFMNNAKAKMEAERLAKERQAQLEREMDLKRREDELAAKERKAEMEERARKQAEQDRLNAEMREKKRLAELEEARIEGERKAKAEAERIEREKKEAEAKAEKSRKFKAWLADQGFTDALEGDRFFIRHTDTEAILYEKKAVYRK